MQWPEHPVQRRWREYAHRDWMAREMRSARERLAKTNVLAKKAAEGQLDTKALQARLYALSPQARAEAEARRDRRRRVFTQKLRARIASEAARLAKAQVVAKLGAFARQDPPPVDVAAVAREVGQAVAVAVREGLRTIRITVQAPPREKVVKTIRRDEHGRIESVLEQPVND
jgi:hypothetical protein